MSTEKKTDAEVRDAVMLYITQVLKLKEQPMKLAFVTSYVYSQGFLKDLKDIRERLKVEVEPIYSLSVLKGVDQPGKEDQDLLGYKLVELIDKVLGNYYDPTEPS